MSEIKIRKNWTTIRVAGIVLSALTLMPIAVVFWDIIFWGTNKQIVKYSTWWTTILIIAVFVCPGIILWWEYLSSLTIKFTNDGIWKRQILGWNFISWKNITHFQFVSFTINIYEHKKKIAINVVYFANPGEVVDVIKERIPSQLLQEI